jgi:hypothetical protein
VLSACTYARRRHRRAPTSYGRHGIPLRDCLQQVEKYDSDSSSVCIEEEVGDEDADEDGARLVSAQPTLALLQTFRGLTCFLLSYFTYVLPFAFYVSVFHRWRTAAP